MAAIGKIRQRSGLVIGLIGIAMLGFIATDLLKNKLFTGGPTTPKGIGMVFGEQIDPQTFKDRFELALKNQQMQNKSAEITVDQQEQMSDQVWQQLTNELEINHEADKLGLTVTGEEIFDLCIGPNPDPLATQYLSDPKTHQIDKKNVKSFIENIADMKPEQQEFWSSFETYLVNERIKAKYNTIVKAGAYYTDLEMEDDYVGKNKTYSIKYVPLMYSSIEDSTVVVTDKDMKDYYDKHKEDYKRENTRTFEYVSFDDRPSAKDTAETLKAILALKEPFKNTKDDSSFVVMNGTGSFSNQYQPRGSFDDPKIEDSIFNYKKDSDFIGPYYKDSAYNLIKIVDHKEDSVYYYRASHILIKPTPGPDKKADSVDAYNKAKKIYEDAQKPGADFAKLAIENSQDEGSAMKGGDLGWFKDGAMVKPFMDAVKNGEKGHLYIVSSQFGTHVIKITENKTNKLVKVGILIKPITVGAETNDKAYGLALAFRTKAHDANSYDETAKAMHLTKRLLEKIKPNQHTIGGLIHPRELIRWAFKDDTKEGSISDPMRITDRYVVAKMVRLMPEGYAPFDEVKKDLKQAAQLEKKKQMLADKLKAAYDKHKSLDEIAKDVKSSVNNADGIIFDNPNVQNLAAEPALVGAIAGSKANTVSQPVKGQSGVFVFEVTNINTIKPPTNYDRDRIELMRRSSGTLNSMADDALRKLADIKDFRYLYY